MTGLTRIARITAPVALVSAALAVASCSGQSSPAQTGSPTAAVSTSASASTILGTTLALAAVSGYTGTLSFSSTPNPSGVTVNSTGYNYAPPSVLPTVPPAALPTNPPGSQPSPSGAATPTVIVAWIFTTTASVTVSQPAETFTGLPTPASGKAYYTYFADMTGGTSSGYNGQGTYSASTQTFSVPGSATSIPLSTNHIYALQVVSF